MFSGITEIFLLIRKRSKLEVLPNKNQFNDPVHNILGKIKKSRKVIKDLFAYF